MLKKIRGLNPLVKAVIGFLVGTLVSAAVLYLIDGSVDYLHALSGPLVASLVIYFFSIPRAKTPDS